MSDTPKRETTEGIVINHSDAEVPPSPYRSLRLAKGLYGSLDPDHCEFCGGVVDDQTGDCPALAAGRCQP